MKRCPKCNETYSDETLVFCREDGAPLQISTPDAESSDTRILPARSSDDLPTRLLQNETVQSKDFSTPFEAAENNRTKKLKLANDFDRYKYIVVAALSVLILSAFGLGFYFIKNGSFSFSTDSALVESVAVMPFVNESGNPEMEYLSDGMTESLINSLSQLPNLNVKARSSVFRYKGREIEPQQIGSELNVQAVLSGRVVQRGQDLILYLSLIDARTGNQIWGDQYNRKTADLVALQSEIARSVSQKLKAKLSGADEQAVAQNYTQNAEAYQLYLRGRFHWNKRTVKDLRKSIEYFQQAAALDPNYALAYTGLADAYSVLPTHDSGVPSREIMPKAREAALKALSLDDRLAESHLSIGLVLHYHDYDFAGAERAFRRAIELSPNSAAPHLYYSGLLMHLGRFEEAYAEIRRALEIEPLSLIINRFYGLTLFYDRKYAESEAQLKKTLELDDSYLTAYHSIFGAYHLQGKYAESVEASARAEEILGNHAGAALIRDIYAKGGWQKLLRALTDPSIRNQINSRHSKYLVAVYHAALGEKEQAFAELNKAYEEREFFIVLLKVDPRVDSLRDDPRFQDLMRKVGFPP